MIYVICLIHFIYLRSAIYIYPTSSIHSVLIIPLPLPTSPPPSFAVKSCGSCCHNTSRTYTVTDLWEHRSIKLFPTISPESDGSPNGIDNLSSLKLERKCILIFSPLLPIEFKIAPKGAFWCHLLV